jgi:hypothetical protein
VTWPVICLLLPAYQYRDLPAACPSANMPTMPALFAASQGEAEEGESDLEDEAFERELEAMARYGSDDEAGEEGADKARSFAALHKQLAGQRGGEAAAGALGRCSCLHVTMESQSRFGCLPRWSRAHSALGDALLSPVLSQHAPAAAQFGPIATAGAACCQP